MKNTFRLGYGVAVVVSVLTLSNNGFSQGTSQNARNVARQECFVENNITVSSKAGKKLTCAQLAVLDTCMKAKGIHVGKRVSCENQ